MQALRPARIVGEVGTVMGAGWIARTKNQQAPVIAVLPGETKVRGHGVVGM